MTQHNVSNATLKSTPATDNSHTQGIGRRTFIGSAAMFAALATMGVITGCSGTSADATSASTASSSSPAANATAANSSSRDGSLAASNIKEASAATDTASTSTNTVAVVYFSLPRPDNPEIDAESGASVVLGEDGTVYGNVEWQARFIAQDTAADLVRIVLDEDYPSGIDDVLDLALAQQDAGEHPAIHLERELADGTTETIDSLDQYTTIYLGYPIWWYELPMPMMSFFDAFDLSGKSVYPFVVHGGSGFSGTIDDITSLEPGASVSQDGLSVNRRDVAADAEQDAADWIAALGTGVQQ